MARGPAGSPGRTLVLITLSGGEIAQREALADRVVAASRDSLAAPAAENRLAAVFAHLSQASGPRLQASAALVDLEAPLRTGTIMPAEPPAPASPPSPYEAPFVLAPLMRPG